MAEELWQKSYKLTNKYNAFFHKITPDEYDEDEYCFQQCLILQKILDVYDNDAEARLTVLKRRLESAYVTVLPVDENYEVFSKEEEQSYLKLTDWMFMTVNPDPKMNISVEKLLDKVHHFVHKKAVKKYLYVIEQRALTSEAGGWGFHCHCLFLHDYKKLSDLKRETVSTFHRVCNTKDWHCLNLKHNLRDTDIKNRETYMMGLKKDPEKQIKQEQDVLWRIKEHLHKCYTNYYEE